MDKKLYVQKWLGMIVTNNKQPDLLENKHNFIITVRFWCQAIHKKFLQRFDTIFGLKCLAATLKAIVEF